MKIESQELSSDLYTKGQKRLRRPVLHASILLLFKHEITSRGFELQFVAKFF